MRAAAYLHSARVLVACVLVLPLLGGACVSSGGGAMVRADVHEQRVPFVPLLMEVEYKPSGVLCPQRSRHVS